MKKLRLLTIALLFVSLAFNACKDDDEPIHINLIFAHHVGSAELEFDTMQYVNSAGNSYSIETLKYLISDFKLHKADGTFEFIDEEHYIDGRDGSTHTFTPAKDVPAGDYTHISFVFGLDTTKNVTGRYTNPPESNMEWPTPMGGGYHYMKFEGKYMNNTSAVVSFNVHTGGTMGNRNVVDVTLPASGFTAASNDISIELVVDLNKWLESPNVYDFNNYTGIMGNQDAQMLLQENGADVFSIGSITQ